MSFITESKKAYKQVKENHVAIAMGKMLDDEGSMLLNQLEELERGIEMLRAYVGNDYEKQLPAWVQSKVTLATDYISTAGNYLSSKNEKVTEETIKESSHLTESTFEKIYQMQQDGKSTEDIAKELKLNPALVKKVLGEQIELKEFTDAMLAALKKEYEPLKGKTITTAQYQQLKNILFKLQDADLEKLQKQNIPFASTGAGSILRVRKSPVKITSVKVPGLEGMAEEKIPQDYLDYLRTIVYKKVDFYEIPPKHIIQHWRDEKNKDRFTGKIIDYKEEVDMSKVTKYKMISIKGDQKEITIDRKDLEKHLKLGYVIKEPLTEEVDLQEKPSRKKHVVFKVGDKLVAKDFRGYNDDEIAKSIDDFLKQNSKSIVVQQSPIQSVTEEPKNPYAIGMAAAMKATGDTPPLKKSTITKAHKIADKVKEEEVNKTNPKSDEKRTIDMTDGSAHVRFPKDDTKAMEFYKSKGYKVTTKYEETELEEACWTGYKKVGMKKKGDRMVPNCVPEGYVTESGDIVEFVELNEGQFKEIDTRKGDLKLAKDKKQNLKDKYNAIMAGQATGDENAIADQIQKLEMSIKKQEQELIDIMKKQRETKKEEVSKEKETEFHKKLDTLVHKTFGKRKDEKMPVKESTSRNINEGARALVEAIAALQKKADKSGMPYSILKQVYDRGMAAWKGGHRPGAGQHQWAFARVNSFVTKSSGTWGGADSDLAKKVKGKE